MPGNDYTLMLKLGFHSIVSGSYVEWDIKNIQHNSKVLETTE